jgi:hypothetical protein
MGGDGYRREGEECGVRGAGCAVRGAGCKGAGCRAQSAECRVQSAECRVRGAGCGVQGCRLQSAERRAQGAGGGVRVLSLRARLRTRSDPEVRTTPRRSSRGLKSPRSAAEPSPQGLCSCPSGRELTPSPAFKPGLHRARPRSQALKGCARALQGVSYGRVPAFKPGLASTAGSKAGVAVADS